MKTDMYAVTELSKKESRGISGGTYFAGALGFLKATFVIAAEAVADAACAVGRVCADTISQLPPKHFN